MTAPETAPPARGLAMLGGRAVVCTDDWCAAPAAPDDRPGDVTVRPGHSVDTRPDRTT